MHLLLQSLNETVKDGSYFGPTLDVILYMLIATLIATLGWYFWQKKDKVVIEKLQKNLEKIKPQYEILTNEHEHLKAENSKIKLGLSDLMNNYNSLKNEHQSHLSTQNSAQNLYEQADEERQSLLDSYESMETNFNALDGKYNDAVSTLDRLEEEIESIKDEKFDLIEINSRLKAGIKKLETISEEKGINIEEIKGSYQIGFSAEDDEIEKLLGQSFLSTSSEDSTVSPDVVAEEKQNLQLAYKSLKEDYNQIRNEHTKLNNQFSDLHDIHNQLVTSSSNKVNPNEKANYKKEKMALVNQLAKIRIEHIQLKKEFEILREEHNTMVLPQLKNSQELLVQKEESFRLLESKLENQSSSKQLKSFDDLKATTQALYNTNKVLNEKHLELQKKYDSISGEYVGLKSQFQLLRERYGSVEKKLDDKVSNNPELGQLSKKYNDIKIEFLASSSSQKELKLQLEEMKQLLKSIKESSNYGIIYLPSNLQIIEGIGPKIEQILNKANIHTWEDAAKINVEALTKILKEGGKRFQMHNPETWPQQATLLVQGKWKAFRDLEAELIAGKRVKTTEIDDLKVVEGIGPKIEILLNKANIHTWKKLSKTGIGELKKTLKAAGSRYQAHDPNTWPEQAGLAASKNWEALKKLQKELKGGRLEA